MHSLPRIGLLSAGADPSLADSCGAAPLHLAVRAGDAACVDALLAASADPSARTADGKTAAHWGAMQADPSSLRALLRRDARQAHAEASGLTPLHVASAADNAAAILALIDAGALLAPSTPAVMRPPSLSVCRLPCLHPTFTCPSLNLYCTESSQS